MSSVHFHTKVCFRQLLFSTLFALFGVPSALYCGVFVRCNTPTPLRENMFSEIFTNLTKQFLTASPSLELCWMGICFLPANRLCMVKIFLKTGWNVVTICVCVRAPACVCNSSYHALIIYTVDVHVVCYKVRALRCLQCHKVRLNGTNSLH